NRWWGARLEHLLRGSPRESRCIEWCCGWCAHWCSSRLEAPRQAGRAPCATEAVDSRVDRVARPWLLSTALGHYDSPHPNLECRVSAQYDRTVERKSAPVPGYRSRLLESCVERDAETLEPLDRSALGMGTVTFHS